MQFELNNVLEFLFRSWHITETVALFCQFTPEQEPGSPTAYHLRLIDDATTVASGKGVEKTILVLGYFEPRLPLCFHSDGETIIFVDNFFVQLLELYIFAYFCDKVSIGGVSVQDHEMVLCALILALDTMRFRAGTRASRVKERVALLERKYSAQVAAMRSIFQFRNLLSEHLPLQSDTEVFPVILHVIVLHELSHILFHKYRPSFEEEVKFVRTRIEGALDGCLKNLRAAPKILRSTLLVDEIQSAKMAKKFYYSRMQGNSPIFTEIFCDFSAAELLITTNKDKLTDPKYFRKLCYRAACTLDAIVKVGTLLNEQSWNSPSEHPLILRHKTNLANSEARLRQMALHVGLTSAMAVPGVVDGLQIDPTTRKLWIAELEDTMKLFRWKRDKLFWTNFEPLRSIFLD